MLTNFIDSKLKRRLLNVLFSFPERSFHQNELKETLRASSRSLSITLSELVKADVVNMAVKKRRKYFRVNPHLSWYDELKELVSVEKVANIDLASQKIKGMRGVKVAVLTGVFTFQPYVEIDLLLVGANVSSKTISHALNSLEKLSGQEVNYCIMDEDEYEYRQHMHDRFIRDILDNPHLVVFDKLQKKKKKNV